jgi:hypothetical protein
MQRMVGYIMTLRCITYVIATDVADKEQALLAEDARPDDDHIDHHEHTESPLPPSPAVAPSDPEQLGHFEEKPHLDNVEEGLPHMKEDVSVSEGLKAGGLYEPLNTTVTAKFGYFMPLGKKKEVQLAPELLASGLAALADLRAQPAHRAAAAFTLTTGATLMTKSSNFIGYHCDDAAQHGPGDESHGGGGDAHDSGQDQSPLVSLEGSVKSVNGENVLEALEGSVISKNAFTGNGIDEIHASSATLKGI